MANYRYQSKTVLMIQKINAVGLSKLRSYVKEKHPKEDFERNIAIIRDYFKSGAEYCYKKYDSERHPSSIILRYYRYATEIERNEQT